MTFCTLATHQAVAMLFHAKGTGLPCSRPAVRCAFRNASESKRRQVHVRATHELLREPKTGIEFPKTVMTWQEGGETMRLLGVGCREKKILMFPVKVYAIAAYVDGKTAVREFGIRSRGGFFADAGTSEYCDAVLDGACGKLLALQLARDVDGDTFVQAIEEALAPRLALIGESASLEDFKDFFMERELSTGTQVLLLWNPGASTLDVKIAAHGLRDACTAIPDKTFKSAGLCRALFEMWLGESAVIPEARDSFAAGTRQLVEADESARGEWKPGGRGTDNP